MSETNCSESGDEGGNLTALLCAFDHLLAAAIDYAEYEHDGDPWSEDARTMGEMDLDDLRRAGKFDEFRSLLDACKKEFLDERD